MDMTKIGQLIASARKKAGLTQEALAEKLSVTPQAVSKWENGHNLPDLENLMLIAEITNIPYTALLDTTEETDEVSYDFRNRLFHEDNMFTRMRTFAISENLSETFRALNYMRECHLGQFRKPNKFSTERILYINHPLLMACQAHAFGLRDDALLASILLHDVVEDTDVLAEELPFSDEVKEIVDLVSFVVPKDSNKAHWKKIYYEKIKSNKKACVVKVLDRCNNVSTMAGSFTKNKLQEYISETEEYIFPLLTELKNNYPEYNDIAFLIKYQLLSLLETIKYLL